VSHPGERRRLEVVDELPLDEPELEDLPLDPSAIHHRYRLERARRRARIRHEQEHVLAGVRFYALLGVLVALGIVLLVLVWDEVGRLFGL
jgi:hypothetical protein